MPYGLRGNTVINTDTGKPVPGGTHKNRRQALAHQRALTLNVPEAKAGSPGDYLVVEDPAKPSTWHLQVKTNGTPDHRLMGASWAALHGGYRGNKYEGPGKGAALDKLKALYASEKMPLPSEKSFAVFKDATGRYRWIARTTTAFEDRDNEVISTKSLAEDVARADADGQYGPLRWWHMGHPNPLSPAPWGPGVDLGWCDFNAMSGKTLVESGTFKSEVIARAVAAKADDLELSPGFFHAPNEPDQTGVFHHIRRFERSLVPKWAGRASNPYTGLVVQGKAMDQKKIEALKTLGVPQETVTELLSEVETTEKEAEAQHVRYKESPRVKDIFKALITGDWSEVTTKDEPEEPVPSMLSEAGREVARKSGKIPIEGVSQKDEAAAPEVEADPVATLKAQVEALTAEVASLKAPAASTAEKAPMDMGMMPDAENPAETSTEAGVEEPADDGSQTLSSGDLAAIGQLLQGLLEPLIGALGITQKLEGHLGELKTMMGGYTKTKDDAEAARVNEIAALKAAIDQQQAKLAELLGEQPRAGYRASAAPDNVLNPEVLAAIKDNGNGGGGADFSDITQKLFPQFGNNRQ